MFPQVKKRKPTLSSQMLLILATSPAAATLTCKAQEERSRLSAWYSIWRHQSNNLYRPFPTLVVRSILHVLVQYFSKNIVITVIKCILVIENACMKCFRTM